MKIIKKSNYRVVIEPETHIYGFELSEDTVKNSLKTIQEQIKRHVDNIGHVGVECDTEELCSHCGLRWEVSEDDLEPDFPKGTPVCCQKAIDEYNEGIKNNMAV